MRMEAIVGKRFRINRYIVECNKTYAKIFEELKAELIDT